MSKLSTAGHFPAKMSCDSLVLLGPCNTGSRCVQICSAALTLVTESSNMAPHGKELSENLKRHIVVLHEDG